MSRKTLEEYVADLHHDDKNVRRTAAMRLMNFEDPLAIQALKGALSDLSASVRFYAKKSLAKLEKTLGTEEVGRHIPVEDEERALLAQVFASLEAGDLAALVPLVDHEKGLVRASAVAALGRIGRPEMDCGGRSVRDRLLAALDDGHGRVVANAIEALQNLDIRPPDEQTMKLLFHEDPRVKANMAVALFHFHVDRPDLQQMALARLREAIENEKPWVRQSGLYALKCIGTPEARELLQSLLTDREKLVREQAEKSLKDWKDRPNSPAPPPPRAAQERPRDEATADLPAPSRPPAAPGRPVLLVAAPVEAPQKEWKERAKMAGIGCGALLLLVLVLAILQGLWEGFIPGPPPPPPRQTSARPETVRPPAAPADEQAVPPAVETQLAPGEAEARDTVEKLSEGVELLHQMDFDAGIDRLRASLAQAPENRGIQALLAAALVEKARARKADGDLPAARQCLDQAREVHAIVAERVLRSELALDEADPAMALAEADAAIALDATHAPAWVALARARQAAGEKAEAVQAAERALELDRTDWRLTLLTGQLLREAGRAGDAVAVLRQGCLLRPTPELYQELVRAAEDAGQLLPAIQAFQQMIRIDPRDPALRESFARLLMKNGMHAPALEQWKALMRVKPGDAQALYQIARCFQSQGDATRMKKFMEMALRSQPDFFEPHYSLGALLTVTGQAPLAEDHLRQAVRLKPDSLEARMLLVTALMDQRKYRPAEEILKSHLLQYPDDRDAHLVMAQALASLAEPDRARQHFQKFLELEPPDSRRRGEVEEFLRRFSK